MRLEHTARLAWVDAGRGFGGLLREVSEERIRALLDTANMLPLDLLPGPLGKVATIRQPAALWVESEG